MERNLVSTTCSSVQERPLPILARAAHILSSNLAKHLACMRREVGQEGLEQVTLTAAARSLIGGSRQVAFPGESYMATGSGNGLAHLP